jgi:hypothetical protein
MPKHLLLAILLLAPNSARAQSRTDPAPRSPWGTQLAVAFYATGHAGSYLAGGIGGRLRYEPFEWLGAEAYLEATIVEWPGAFRHDYPNGFNIYTPIRIDDVRIKPYIGFCDILSFIEPAQALAPRADDVLFGAHAGVGIEIALHRFVSVFADVQGNVYMGHDRTAEMWTGGVGEDFVPFWNIQLNLGVQGHVLER